MYNGGLGVTENVFKVKVKRVRMDIDSSPKRTPHWSMKCEWKRKDFIITVKGEEWKQNTSSN